MFLDTSDLPSCSGLLDAIALVVKSKEPLFFFSHVFSVYQRFRRELLGHSDYVALNAGQKDHHPRANDVFIAPIASLS